jgi:hypothetical protein
MNELLADGAGIGQRYELGEAVTVMWMPVDDAWLGTTVTLIAEDVTGMGEAVTVEVTSMDVAVIVEVASMGVAVTVEVGTGVTAMTELVA